MPMTSNPRISHISSAGSNDDSMNIPAYISYLFEAHKRMARIIKKVSREFEKQIREDARNTWGAVADTIKVMYNAKENTLDVFSTHPDANKLEYGGPDNPPYPVLRNAALHAQTKFADRVSELLYKSMS